MNQKLSKIENQQNPVEIISKEIDFELDRLINQIPEKEKFARVCELYFKETKHMTLLNFCVYIRKHGFPVAAKAIALYFMQTDPGKLANYLAA